MGSMVAARRAGRAPATRPTDSMTAEIANVRQRVRRAEPRRAGSRAAASPRARLRDPRTRPQATSFTPPPATSGKSAGRAPQGDPDADLPAAESRAVGDEAVEAEAERSSARAAKIESSAAWKTGARHRLRNERFHRTDLGGHEHGMDAAHGIRDRRAERGPAAFDRTKT